MQSIKQTPPERMTPDQRRVEVATLLALGLVRLREHNAQKSAKGDGESELDLGFRGDQRIHSNPINERTKKSE